jgi:hypothetical protein
MQAAVLKRLTTATGRPSTARCLDWCFLGWRQRISRRGRAGAIRERSGRDGCHVERAARQRAGRPERLLAARRK